MATATAAEPAPSGAMTPRPFRVAAREQDTADTWTLTLEPLAARAAGDRAGAVHDGLRVRDRRGADLGQRAARPARPGRADGPRGRRRLARDLRVGARRGARAARAVRNVVADRRRGGRRRRRRRRRDRARAAPAGRPARARRTARTTARSPCSTARARPADLLYTAQLEEWRATIEVAVTVDAAGADWAGPGRLRREARPARDAPPRARDGVRLRARRS